MAEAVCASGEARSEFGLPDVLAPKECEDHEGKQLDLFLAKLREVRGKVAGQLGEDIAERVPFSRVSRAFPSSSVRCQVLRLPYRDQVHSGTAGCNLIEFLF
jgi:hypothetical protein